MKVKTLRSFSEKLADQVEFIAKDKPQASRKFKKDVLFQLKNLGKMPYKNRKSIHFESEHIREIIFRGYKIIYRINLKKNCIEVFGFLKYQETP